MERLVFYSCLEGTGSHQDKHINASLQLTRKGTVDHGVKMSVVMA